MGEIHNMNKERLVKEAELFKKLDGIYETLTNLHPANTTWRFRHAPFMPQPPEDSEYAGVENIAGHMWLTTELAKLVFHVLPNATQNMDKMTILDMLSLHDVGEIAHGDVSAYLQLNGYKGNRKEQEDEAFLDIISPLPQETKALLLKTHTRYEKEKNNPHTNDKEALFSKVMDTIQGDHNVLTYSPNFLEYAVDHKKILEAKLLPFTKSLEEVLIGEENEEGAREINNFTRHHLLLYKKRGVHIPYPLRS